MLTLKLLDFFYLDNYANLWDKYHDPFRFKSQNERSWAYANYKEYFNRAWKEKDFRLMIALRRAKRDYDYITLYNLMIDMDGDLDGQIIVK